MAADKKDIRFFMLGVITACIPDKLRHRIVRWRAEFFADIPPLRSKCIELQTAFIHKCVRRINKPLLHRFNMRTGLILGRCRSALTTINHHTHTTMRHISTGLKMNRKQLLLDNVNLPPINGGLCFVDKK